MVLSRTATLCLAAALTLTPSDRATAGGPETTRHLLPATQPQPGPPSRAGGGSGSVDPPAAGRWSAPITVPRIAAPFDPPAQPWLPGHRGVDLVTSPGQVVRAAGTGRVAFAGSVAGRPVLSIDHGGLRTTYEPVTSRRSVGDWVAAGEAVGTVGRGSGHCGPGFCLHLGLRRGTQYLDPLLLLGHHRVLLRPW